MAKFQISIKDYVVSKYFAEFQFKTDHLMVSENHLHPLSLMRFMDVIIDTETTGFDSETDGIISVGIAWRDPETRNINTMEWECNPGEECWKGGRAAEALSVNGYTEEQIASFPPVEEVAPKVKQFLRELDDKYGIIIHAYNISFDLPFLNTDIWEMHSEFEWGPCIMIQAKNLWNPYGRWLKLTVAFKRVQPQPNEAEELLRCAHSASSDCIMALYVWEHILKKKEVYRRV